MSVSAPVGVPIRTGNMTELHAPSKPCCAYSLFSSTATVPGSIAVGLHLLLEARIRTGKSRPLHVIHEIVHVSVSST